MNETAIKILEDQYKILPGLRWFMYGWDIWGD